MSIGVDPRFASAAVFGPDGHSLKKSTFRKFAKLGWTRDQQWRSADFRGFHFCSPPFDYSAWEMGPKYRYDVSARFDAPMPVQRAVLAETAITFIGECPPDLRTSLKLATRNRQQWNLAVDEDGPRLSITVSDIALGLPPARVLEAWIGCEHCVYSKIFGADEVPLTSWTVQDIHERVTGLPRYSVRLRGLSQERFAIAAAALRQEVTGKVTYASCAVNMHHAKCQALFPGVRERVPSYTFSIFAAGYADSFDPFARPAAADAGETVRYPLVNCERPKLDKDGRKDIAIDIVHRPQGDCYFDLQVFDYTPADDTTVRQTLAEALETLDVKAEIWDGDPFKRWE